MSDLSSKRVLAIFVGLVLLASISTIMPLPLQSAAAQGTTITTSADSHGGTFFGDGVLQVVINDPDADDDDVQEDITVEIDAESNTGSSSSGAFVIFETSKDSGRFEFFLLHGDSIVIAPDLDAINENGAQEYDSLVNEAPMIRFGVGEELPLDTGLYEDVSFDITVGDEEVTIDFEESAAELELDRSTYGSDSLVYIFIIDQDGNINPLRLILLS